MPQKCRHQGCNKAPSFGEEGSTKREFCSGHKRDGMVDLLHKRCGHQGCTKTPSFGVVGTNKREFCSGHKRDGMVDLKNKGCLHHGCTKAPNFGVVGSNKTEFCSGHKRDGMVDLKNKGCLHQGCNKAPSFGVVGSNKREFCSGHKTDGMVDLKNRGCLHQGCNTRPSYGVDGSNNREFCVCRGTPGMTPTRSRRTSTENQGSTELGHERGGSTASTVSTRRVRVGEKRKGGALSPPSPSSCSSATKTQHTDKGFVPSRRISSAAVPVKEEGGAAGASAGVSPVAFSPIVFAARKNAVANAQISSFDPEDRVKAEVSVS